MIGVISLINVFKDLKKEIKINYGVKIMTLFCCMIMLDVMWVDLDHGTWDKWMDINSLYLHIHLSLTQ